MYAELMLDCDEATPKNKEIALKKFRDWYCDGSEVRHNKKSFSSLTNLDIENHFLVDFGYAEPLSAIRNLHARVRSLGVKVFVHFIN